MSEMNINDFNNNELDTSFLGVFIPEDTVNEELFPDSDKPINVHGLGETPNMVSQEKRRVNTVSNDLRYIIINRWVSGESVTQIASSCGIPRTTAASIITKYKSTGIIVSSLKGGDRRTALTLSQKFQVQSWVDENPLLSLQQLKTKVEETFRIITSISTIDRTLRSFHYTLKVATRVPERRNSINTIETRYDYAMRFRELETSTRHENLIFIDEVGFQVVTRPKRARSLRGTGAYTQVSAARSRNISVLAACNKNGMIGHLISNVAYNGESFINGMLTIKQKCAEKGIFEPVFVMDNARIHHYGRFTEVIAENNFQVVYLPPYSPFLNPIENVFSVWKNMVSRAECQNEQSLMETITGKFNEITESHCDGFYRKMLRYIQRSLDREEILE